MFLAQSSSGDDDEWEAVDDDDMEHADHPSSKWCWTKRGLRMTAPFLNVSNAGVQVVVAAFSHTCRRAECRLFLQGGVQ